MYMYMDASPLETRPTSHSLWCLHPSQTTAEPCLAFLVGGYPTRQWAGRGDGAMGNSASALIDELHTAAMLPDDTGLQRKLKALRTTRELAKQDRVSLEVVEQGGLQPLAKCYNSSHPDVRVEAARTLASLAALPANQVEMGQNDVLPMLIPALLTGESEFKSHAMAVMACLAIPEENKLKLVHEGCLPAIIEECTSSNVPLRLHALKALAHLAEQPLISVMAAQRGALKQLLRAARSDHMPVKLGTLRALVGLSSVGDNLSQVVCAGTPIYLLSCTYCSAEMQLQVARCFEKLLEQTFTGTHHLDEDEALMLHKTCGFEVNREARMVKVAVFGMPATAGHHGLPQIAI